MHQKARVDSKSGYSLAYAFAISNSLLNAKNLLIQGNETLYNANSTLNIGIIFVSAILYIYALFFEKRKHVVYKKQLFVLTFILFIWLITYLFNTSLFSYSYVREEISEFITYSLPALLFLPMLDNCDDLLNAFYKWRWFMFISGCIAVMMIMRTGTIQDAGTRYTVYSMAFGRSLLLPCFLFVSSWFKEHKMIDAVCSVICVAFILIFGSRFPLLCIFCFIVWKVIQPPVTKKKQAILFVGVLLISLNFNSIVHLFINYFSEMGINSRSLYLLESGSFNYDSGRGEIITQLIGEVNKSPIWGYGAGGGNVALNNGLSHSFIVDTFANLGYVFGGAFLIVTFFQIIKKYIHSKIWSTKEYMMICMCNFFPICLMQTSLWRASYFWILIALSSGCLNNRKKE